MMATWQEIAAAEVFLKKKLIEYVAQSNVPALAAVLVRDAGATIVSGQEGIRKLGATGDQNTVQDTDRFNTGSISKVLAAHLIGALIDSKNKPDGLSWDSTLGEVMPELFLLPGAKPVYQSVTIDQYSAHVSGMPYTPFGQPSNDGVTGNPSDFTPEGRIALRRFYVQNAIKDALVTKCAISKQDGDATCNQWGQHDMPRPGEMVCEPGLCMNYSGGQIINAAMLERLTGTVFEDLMQQYIFGPLNMTRSRFGRASEGADDGPWQHTWDAANFKVAPNPATQLLTNDASPRNPVGGMCCNAADLGRFLAETVRPVSQVFTFDTRRSMQSTVVSANSNYMRGAWVSDTPGSPTADIGYVGDNGSMYAEMHASLSNLTAVGAMCNMNNTFAGAAVADMIDTARAFDTNWTSLFGDGAPEPRVCAHAMPALVATGNLGRNLTVFARRQSGEMIRRHSADGGKNWGAAIGFPGWTMTSGLAAAATPDGAHMYLFGRGTDNQIWFAKASVGRQQAWQGSWAVPFGTFMTGPAVGVTANGQGLHLVAVGMDRRMYHTQSGDGGQTWGTVTTIGAGTFTSAPAITVSSDGSIVHVFGRGEDYRIWTNSNAGLGWQPHWAPIGQGVFTSGPGATASDDGSRVHVIGRGTDRNMWHNWTGGFGQDWQPHWKALAPLGALTSAPAVAMHGPGPDIYLAAFGGDFAIWTNHTANEGGTWDGFAKVGPDPGLFI
jgi:CubicO group peptidase (beta-lactamase class C family)